MKKHFSSILSILFCFFLCTRIFAQGNLCTFQPNLPLTGALIYPLPFTDDPNNPFDLGINKEAVIGKPFEFTWTVVWPEKFIAPVVGLPATADTQTFFLQQTMFIFDKDTMGILPGLKLEMFPENGILLPKNNEPAACIKLSGTPASSVKPGDYQVVFVIKSCLDIPGVFTGCQDALIPSFVSGFPGEYRLRINPEGTVAVKETLNDKVSLVVSPNPFSDKTIIQFNSVNLKGQYELQLYDSNGRNVVHNSILMKSSVQRLEINADGLADGVYFYLISGQDGLISGKLLLQR